MNYEQIYQTAINPINLIKHFKNRDEFFLWLIQGSKADLEHTLKAFEEAELYEHCTIIKEVLSI